MLRIPGCRKAWGHWRTKDNTALYCRFLGKKGQINLAKVEGIGVNPEIETGRQDGDVLQLVFLQMGHLAPDRLKSVLPEHAKAFREHYAK
jgi:excinuclease ABC subunit A